MAINGGRKVPREDPWEIRENMQTLRDIKKGNV